MVVKRVNTVYDLSDQALKCYALGRHAGFLDDPHVDGESTGFWGPQIDSRQIRYLCDCTRTKQETINWNTGELLTNSPFYDGGELPILRVSRREAMLVWLQRLASRISGQKRKKERAKVVAIS